MKTPLLASIFLTAVSLLGAAETQTLYLSGRGSDDAQSWDFFCVRGRNSGFWTTIRVPSCWEQEGFGTYDYGYEQRGKQPLSPPLTAHDEGIYRRKFEVPSDWRGQNVRIVFEGVMTDTRIRLNGTEVGPVHQGGFYRFSYDLTALLRWDGVNELEVTVREFSENESVNRAERTGDYWNFGGIFRPVWLEARPQFAIERLAIDARADGVFNADIFLSKSDAVGELSLQVVALDGSPVGAPVGAPLTAHVDAGTTKVRVTGKVSNVSAWSAETPHLYRVQAKLLVKGAEQHRVSERFGFRTFEVRPGDGFYLNGHKLTLKGTNRHSFWPETARTLNMQRHREDIALMKEANMNAVRMAHYPPDPEFLALCDEAGLYVLNELAGWQGGYDTPTGRRLIAQIVMRDVNHPSILFWDNGNEGGESPENDDEFAKYDPQARPVLQPWKAFRGIQTRHYRPFDVTAQLAEGPDIFMPTEFLHGLYDGGHGAGLDDYWKIMGEKPLAAGGFLWSWADEAVARSDQGGRLDGRRDLAPDGLLGPHHEKKGSFYTVRDVWSPVQIPLEKLPADFDGRLAVRNRYDFLSLATCRFEWQLLRYHAPGVLRSHRTLVAFGATAGPEIAARKEGFLTLSLPSDWRSADVLQVRAYDSLNREISTWAWSLQTQVVPAPAPAASPDKSAAAASLTVRDDGNELVLESGRVSARIDRRTGTLATLTRDGRALSLSHGPRVVAYRRNERTFYPDPTLTSRIDVITQEAVNGAAVVDVSYTKDSALRKVRWHLDAAGDLRIEYILNGPGTCEILGIDFDYPEEKMKSKDWLGAGPTRVWQNRLRGPYIDRWDLPYNDSIPGEDYALPEFKGWFRDWRWIAFTTTEGRFAFLNDGSHRFLGVYSPRDGKINPVLNLPRLGIGAYHVIPATGTKGSLPEQLGPQSQPQTINGEVRGSLTIRTLDAF